MPPITFTSFRNVGVRQFETQMIDNVSQSLTPIGIATPISFGTEDLFTMNMTISEQIVDNLRNLTLTNSGERLGLYDFGANLKPLVSEYSNKEAFDEEAMIRINTAVSRWMPFVELEGYSSSPNFDENVDTGVIELYIRFSVPRVNIRSRTLRVTLFVL